MSDRVDRIRKSEKKSHTIMYSNEELYQTDSWLNKPIKTVQELMPLFSDYRELRVLDLGCGVGRNCIAIAKEFKAINCVIDCVDILEIAIQKLYYNAKNHNVESNILGKVETIENFKVNPNTYDLIMAISALEHVDTEEAFVHKLVEIRDGLKQKGVVCLVINSNVREWDKATGQAVSAQFEINVDTDNLKILLEDIFGEWKIIKETIREQQYDIPREFGVSDLKTNVVTLVARKL